MKRRVISLWVIVILFFLFPLCLFSQQESSVKVFNSSNGMLQNSVFGVSPDDMGYLWIATQNSLVRYDGTSFKKYLLDPLKPESAPSNIVHDMSGVPEEKKLLLRTKDGVVYTIKNGRPLLYSNAVVNEGYYYGTKGHFPNEKIFNQFNLSYTELMQKHNWNSTFKEILPLNNSDFLVLGRGDRNALFLYKNGVHQKNVKTGTRITILLRAGKHSLYADSAANLYLYDSIESKFKGIANELNLFSKKTGNAETPEYFFDDYNNESYCYYNSVFFRLKVDIVNNIVKLIPVFQIKKEGHRWTNILYDPGSDTYFIGTLTDGLFQVKVKKIQTFNLNERIGNNVNANSLINYSVLKTSDSTVLSTTGYEFTSTASGITIKKKGNIFSNRETIAKSGKDTILCANGSGLLYYVSADGYKKGRFYNETFNKNYPTLVTLLKPEGDSVWVCNGNSIFVVKKDTVINYFNKEKNLGIKSSVKMFYRISDTEVIISTGAGINRMKTIPSHRLDSIPGIGNKGGRHVSRYKDLLIVSVYRAGLYILRNNQVYKVPIDDDKPQLSLCHSTYIDTNGYVWITTDNGLFKSSIDALVEAAFKPGLKPYYFGYGVEDGIVNTEFNGAGTPTYAVLPNGQLFYPSMGGIVTFKPDDLKYYASNASIPVERIMIDKLTIDSVISDTVFLDAGYKFLAFDLSVPNFGDPQNLLLEYSLDKTGWKRIPIKPYQRLQLMEDLSPGYHQLVFRKRTGFGSNDYVYKTITLYKKKHLYEQIWFLLLITLGTVLMVFGMIRLKTREINRKREQLQRLVNEQTSELSKTVEVKELLINIISHDMTTPLRHISFISEILAKGLEKDPERMTTALYDIKSTSEKLLTGSVSIINWMKYNNQRVEIIKKTENLNELVDDVAEIYMPVAKSKGVTIINEVNKNELVEVDHTIVSTIINNLISNAVKYSLKGEVKITAERKTDGTGTVVKIIDNGRGIKFETLWVIREVVKGNIRAIKTTTKLNTGLGFIMISELIRLHGLSLTIESEVNEGTTVALILPTAEL